VSVAVHDYSMVVGGAWAESESGGRTEATSPATGESLGTVPEGTRIDAARAIAAALVDAGVPELRLVNRTLPRAEQLAADIGGPIKPCSWQQSVAALKDAALLVNSTMLGMRGQRALDVDVGVLPPFAVVYDIVYAPLETPLLAAARKRGLTAVDGLGMLLHQARPGFAAWFGVEPQVTRELRDFLLADLAA